MAGYRDPTDHGYQFSKLKWEDRNPYPVGSKAYRDFIKGTRLYHDGEPRPNGDVQKVERRERENFYD